MMTNLTDMAAKERIADLKREAATERLVGIARVATGDRGARRVHRWQQGSLVRALNSHNMPPEEIRAVLRAEDPAVVARYMELHRERLIEQLADRVRKLEALERILARRSKAAAPR